MAGGPVRAGGGRDHLLRSPAVRVRGQAVDASRHLTPPSLTPWPRISGTVRARIDGSAESEFAPARRARALPRAAPARRERAARRRRLHARAHAPAARPGNPEGMHLPLRKGTEVQVGFLRGDPDQPVIVGVTPNKATPSPVVQANHSQNVLQTGGLSRIEIEDKQGPSTSTSPRRRRRPSSTWARTPAWARTTTSSRRAAIPRCTPAARVTSRSAASRTSP